MQQTSWGMQWDRETVETREAASKKRLLAEMTIFQDFLAEEVGFEPTVPGTGTPVFETGPFNHSGTPPCALWANSAPAYEKLGDPGRIL
jgi:hypothetical protein